MKPVHPPDTVAPPDSPQIRMRAGMAQAQGLAPARSEEAPTSEGPVNDTGDGTYCITERSPLTGADLIEKHARQRFTRCPRHEEPAGRQA